MSEVNYTCPLSFPTRIVISTATMVPAVLSWITLGFNTNLTRVFFFVFHTMQIMWFVIDPRLCYIWFSRKQPDGSKVRVKRPVVGFKRWERVRGLVDDEDDGYRHERALLRV